MPYHASFILIISLLFSFATQSSNLSASKIEKEPPPEVKGTFSPGGMALKITSQAELELLWALQVDYCDGSSESIGRHVFRIKWRAPISGAGYTFYADKPMKRVIIVSLPIGSLSAAPNFRLTTVRRNCDNADPLPKLYCHDVQVSRVIHRAWEGEPISFKSTRHVAFTGLKFPGVDGLAPARVADYHPNRYYPSVSYDPGTHTWTGTFISLRIPVGEYKNVVLVVRDDFGQQAKCPAGSITVIP
jgi:hypothetical protein